MLIAIVTAFVLFVGSGDGTFSFKALMVSFKAAIHDDSRLDRIEKILGETNDDLEAFRKQIDKTWSHELVKLQGDYQATREQYQGIFKQVDTQSAVLQKDLLDRRFAIKSMLTTEEWARYQAHLKARAPK